MHRRSGATVTVSCDNKMPTKAEAACKILKAYILSACYYSDETVKSDLSRLLLLVDESETLTLN